MTTYKRWIALVIFIVAAPLMAACGTIDADVQFRMDDDFNYLTVTLPEEDVAEIIAGALQSEGTIQNVTADLRPGQIAATGQVANGDGSLVTGNLTIEARVDADAGLVIEVVSFDFAGFILGQAQIDQINADIAAGIAADGGDDDGELTDVTITDSELSFSIRSPRN